MKIIGFRDIILAFVLLLFLSHNIYAQKGRMDIFSEEYLQNKLDSIRNSELKIYSLFDELNRNFHDYQLKSFTNGNNILTSFLYDSYLPRNSTHEFLLHNKDHFTDDQVQKIRIYLDKNILPTDHYYHKLVLEYSLFSQIDFLKKNISDSLFYFIREEINRKNIISYELDFQLKNWSTLVNFESDFTLEDSLLNEINSLYMFIKKECKNNLMLFYDEIIPNSLFFIKSKNSVIKTLYLLDEKEIDYSYLQGDVGSPNFGYINRYFFFTIEDKIKSGNVIMLGSSIQQNEIKEKIKAMILNDNTIWKDNIRIE